MRNLILMFVCSWLLISCVESNAPSVATTEQDLRFQVVCEWQWVPPWERRDTYTYHCCAYWGDTGKACLNIGLWQTPEFSDIPQTSVEVEYGGGRVLASCLDEQPDICGFEEPDGTICIGDGAEWVCSDPESPRAEPVATEQDEPRNCGPGSCGRLGCYCHPDPLAGAVAQ